MASSVRSKVCPSQMRNFPIVLRRGGGSGELVWKHTAHIWNPEKSGVNLTYWRRKGAIMPQGATHTARDRNDEFVEYARGKASASAGNEIDSMAKLHEHRQNETPCAAIEQEIRALTRLIATWANPRGEEHFTRCIEGRDKSHGEFMWGGMYKSTMVA